MPMVEVSNGGTASGRIPNFNLWGQRYAGGTLIIDKNQYNENAVSFSGQYYNPGNDPTSYIDGSNDNANWTRLWTNVPGTFSINIANYRYIRCYSAADLSNRSIEWSNMVLS